MLSKEPGFVFCLGFGMGVAACSSMYIIKKVCFENRLKPRERPSNPKKRRPENVGITGNIAAVNDLEQRFFRGIDRKARLTLEQIQNLKTFLRGVVRDNVQQLDEAQSLESILHLLRRLNVIPPKRYRLILTILENSRIGVNIDSLTFHVNGLEQAVEDIEEAILPRGYERDVFELDVLILHTEDDRLGAFQFKEHLVRDSDVGGLSVQLYEEFNINRPLLEALGNVLNRTRYVFVYMTRHMENDTLRQFMAEMTLLESLEDSRKNFRIVPVWTTRERLNVPIMRPFPGIRYWQYTDEILDLREMYLTGLNKILVEGRENFVRTDD